jgi:hypothetical protein
MSTVIGLVYGAILLVGVIDASRYSYEDWCIVGRDKNFWLVMLFFFGPLFILPYLLAVRPRLRATRLMPHHRKGRP